MDELLITSEIKKLTYFLNWSFSFAVFGFGCLCIYKGLNADVYIDLMPLFMGVFMLILGFVAIYMVASIKKLEIYKDKLEATSIFGFRKQTIYKNEITRWTEIEKKAKSDSFMELVVYTPEKKYKISSRPYHNYLAIKELLTQGKERDTTFEKYAVKHQAKNTGIVFLILGILLFGISVCIFILKHEDVFGKDVTTIQQIVSAPLQKIQVGRNQTYIKLRLMQYPGFKFDIEDNAYTAMHRQDLLEHVKAGDTLFADILTQEYQKKLTGERALNFFDKTMNYRSIPVYGLRDKNRVYLKLSEFNKARNAEGNFMFCLLGVISLLLSAKGVYELNKSKKME